MEQAEVKLTVAEKINEVFEAEGRPLNARQIYYLLCRDYPDHRHTPAVIQVILSRLLRQRKLDIISHEGARYFYYKRIWKLEREDYGFIYDELAQNYIKKCN